MFISCIRTGVCQHNSPCLFQYEKKRAAHVKRECNRYYEHNPGVRVLAETMIETGLAYYCVCVFKLHVYTIVLNRHHV